MSRLPPITFWLRGVAVAIALLAALDPAVTTARNARLTVALAQEDSVRDSQVVERVRQALAKDFTVVPSPFSAAEVTVYVGRSPAPADRELRDPVISVSSSAMSRLDWIQMEVPSSTPLSRSLHIAGTLQAVGAAGGHALVRLQVDGVTVATQDLMLSSNDTLLHPRLGFVPTATGLTRIRLTAELQLPNAQIQAAAADAAVEVQDRKWSVLVYDPRPSWMSTFVRRSLEIDPAFEITSRVLTSKNISTAIGAPPTALSGLMALDPYDVIIIGAPEELTAVDVNDLEALLRRRAAQIIFLPDRVVEGPYTRLLGALTWQQDSSRLTALHPVAGDSLSFTASDIAWPRRLPPTAEVVAYAVSQKGDTTHHPVIWRTAVGAGKVTVSGALNSWSFRDQDQSGFNAFWRSQVATIALTASTPIALSLEPAFPRPGEEVILRVTLRDQALQLGSLTGPNTVQSSVAAFLLPSSSTIEQPAAPTHVSLWPSGVPGELIGRFRAESGNGEWRLRVSSDAGAAELPFLVALDARRAAIGQTEILTGWSKAHGGSVVSLDAIHTLPEMIRNAAESSSPPTRWHPMRSFWWLLPFVCCLTAEWWLRRQRGLA